MGAKILIRICALSIIIGVLNVIYNCFFYERDLQEKYPEALQLEGSQDTTDIYYFGESSNTSSLPSDSSQSSISSLMSQFYPQLNVTNINKNATHAGIYREWLKQLKEAASRPRAIAVTLNLRSFDATWINSNLETQLREPFVLTQPYPNIVNRFLLALQAFDNKTEKEREHEMLERWRSTTLRFPFAFRYSTVAEWDHAMAQGTYLKADGSWDMEKIQLACHFIKAYAFNLDDSNARIKDFDAIKEWCSKNNVKLYLNLMAENTEYADSLVGKELVFLMRENRDYLVKRYNGKNCVVVDNLEAVRGKDFIDQNWTTEHYVLRGRMKIAKNLADSIRSQFNEYYKNAY